MMEWLYRIGLAVGLVAQAVASASLMSEDERLTAARQGGDYLLRTLGEDGRFIYVVEPADQEVDDSYNMLRHAGAIYALCQLYEVTGDERYREGAKRAGALLAEHVHDETIEGKTFKVLVSDYSFTYNGRRRGRVVKTGGCALAVAAFLSIDRAFGTETYTSIASGLGTYIIYTQLPTGNIRSKYMLDKGRFDDWESSYYPGEALVALAMLQTKAPSQLQAEAMTRLLLYLATNWEVENLDRGLAVRDFDHWSLIAFGECYQLLDPELLVKFSPPLHPWSREKLLATADQYCRDELRRQLVEEGNIQDGDLVPKRGGDTTPTATRLEGITSIYRLLLKEGKDVTGWKAPIERSLRFLRRGQFQDDLATNVDINVVGGVRRNVVLMARRAAEIRIDYCQHAISAWLGYPEK